ncbi:MAG: hypothetical protein CL916_11220 [Deltaproteobacteria bacterium]|nr:hypothetical protein [Deltaproteobacteria bacterium]
MSDHLLYNIPPQHQEKAEEIRAYLVHVRGGAPFLSGADCRLLTTWLDDDISILAITTAIDRVAEKRRAKRVRSRLSLNNCKGTLKKVLGKKTKPNKNLKPIVHIGLHGLAQRIQEIPLSEVLLSYQNTLVENLTKLSQENIPIQEKAEKAIGLCRVFHEKVWESHIDQHEDLRVKAEKELESLRPLLGMQHWREMVEEVMRDKIRSQYPLISAQSIWNAINLSDNEKHSV